jgi:hypothetical protein
VRRRVQVQTDHVGRLGLEVGVGLLLAPGGVLPAGPRAGRDGRALVATLVGGLEGAAVVGGLSALGAALTQLGVPKDRAIK